MTAPDADADDVTTDDDDAPADGRGDGHADGPDADDADAPTDPPHDAELIFGYATPELARLVERSIGQEVGEIEGERTRATVECDGATVRVRVCAMDLVALRAGLNTWCSLVEVAEGVATDDI